MPAIKNLAMDNVSIHNLFAEYEHNMESLEEEPQTTTSLSPNPTLDLRTPSKDAIRTRKRSAKYNHFRDVNPGQVGRPHYATETTDTRTVTYTPYTYGEDGVLGAPETYTYTYTRGVLPGEEAPQTMTKRMLWRDARGQRMHARACAPHGQGRWGGQRKKGLLKCGVPAECASEGRGDVFFQDWDCPCYIDAEFYRADEEVYVLGEGKGADEMWQQYLWRGEGDGGDMAALVDGAVGAWEEKRWRGVEREWSEIAENDVEDERMVVVSEGEMDWWSEDEWDTLCCADK